MSGVVCATAPREAFRYSVFVTVTTDDLDPSLPSGTVAGLIYVVSLKRKEKEADNNVSCDRSKRSKSDISLDTPKHFRDEDRFRAVICDGEYLERCVIKEPVSLLLRVADDCSDNFDSGSNIQRALVP